MDYKNNEFDKWNNQKKIIELQENYNKSNFYPGEGEVWMCIVGKNIGYEQNGSGEYFIRPVIILKKFNNKMFWIISLSSKQKDLDFYYNFQDNAKNNVSIILSQMRLISIKRLKRKMYDLNKVDFLNVKLKIIKLLIS